MKLRSPVRFVFTFTHRASSFSARTMDAVRADAARNIILQKGGEKSGKKGFGKIEKEGDCCTCERVKVGLEDLSLGTLLVDTYVHGQTRSLHRKHNTRVNFYRSMTRCLFTFQHSFGLLFLNVSWESFEKWEARSRHACHTSGNLDDKVTKIHHRTVSLQQALDTRDHFTRKSSSEYRFRFFVLYGVLRPLDLEKRLE